MAYPRTTILQLWLCGVLAAAQLGKFSALAPVLQGRFGLDLPAIGLLVSLLEVGGAIVGFAAGMVLPAIGAQRALLTGLYLLIVMTVIEAVARSTPILFVARAAEGIGYLLVVIAAPTLIVSATNAGRERDTAMVLWSTFIPVGSGLGSIATGLTAGMLSATGAIMIWAFAVLALIPAVARLPASTMAERHAAMPATAAWLLSAGFGCYTLFLCAVVGLMPSFLHEQHGVGLTTGSVMTGIVALSALPGSLLALVAIRRLATRPGPLSALSGIALVTASVFALLIFRVESAMLAAAVAMAMLLFAGVVRAMIFAKLPRYSGGDHAGDPRIASAQGLLTQFGALGALLGPPAGGALVKLWSWSALGSGIALAILALLGLMIGAEMAHRWR